MGLENLESVDAIGLHTNDGAVVLTIFDAWNWSDEHKHLRVIQERAAGPRLRER
jgi:hypothetical protein